MDKLRQRIETLLTELKYYLYDMEYVKEHGEQVLRILIDNDTEITLDDCVIVSHKIGEMLDQDDPFTDPYNLEVTSAGAERELRTADEIARAINKWVYIETFEQKLTAKLLAYKNGELTLHFKNKKTTTINEMDINHIRLTVVL
ncbi:ribosome maturation factor RimP [Candidatus Xianfuyuplasma coldseepsis]|uniref:Ribosome maturation factor RimP n=1 Tax=Candidatus Xianfuyuplasma coldseepsis TaxID=2782163 RepID=A0A7L7KRD8_9MOLU|nr:ribosome maturation factor RimP [Xianfuyuplasma coldseepsis]QMS84368.1 ribosome maturation factor RimP [Xianfuyuplasma coldseepsis]